MRSNVGLRALVLKRVVGRFCYVEDVLDIPPPASPVSLLPLLPPRMNPVHVTNHLLERTREWENAIAKNEENAGHHAGKVQPSHSVFVDQLLQPN